VTAAVAERCRRCGTVLRNNRRLCPCCGLDTAAADASAADAPAFPQEDAAGAHRVKQVAAKAGVKLCAICMASVPEQELVEHENQQICPTCAENVRMKQMRKAGQPLAPTRPPPRPPPEAAPSARGGVGPVRVEPLPGAVKTLAPSAGAMVAKIVLTVLGVLNALGGGLMMLGGGPYGVYIGGLNVFFGISVITGWGLWLTRIFMVLAILGQGGLAVLMLMAGVLPLFVLFGASAVLNIVILWLTYVVHKN